MSPTSSKLRDIADKIDSAFASGSTITFRSQNMRYDALLPYIVEKLDGSRHDMSCRGERLSTDTITVHGEWVTSHRRGRGGVFRTPDKKIWLVTGDRGDAWSASDMGFRDITDSPRLADTLRDAVECVS